MPKQLRAARPVEARESELQRAELQISAARYGSALLLLPIDQVRPNPRNPRTAFIEESINELAESIKVNKQLQPVIVRKVGGHYELIAGERRLRAVQRAGLAQIWAVERAANDTEAYKLAIVENLHREDLSQADKVAALDQLAELTESVGLNQTARELSMSPGWLSQQLSIRRNPRLFPALERGAISFGIAGALQRAPAHTQQTLLDRTLSEHPSLTTVRGWVDQLRTAQRGAEAAITRSLSTRQAASVNGQAQLVPSVEAMSEPSELTGIAPYAHLLATALTLRAPASEKEIAALAELVDHLQRVWAGVQTSQESSIHRTSPCTSGWPLNAAAGPTTTPCA